MSVTGSLSALLSNRQWLKLGLALAIAAPLTLASCGGEKAATEDSTEVKADTVAAADTATTAVDDFFDKIPSASTIPGLLQRSGAEYSKNLSNTTGKADKYAVSATKAALNLGVYGADMAYMCAYEKNKEAQAYFTDVQKLAEYLNANDAFGAAMIERMKKNVENNDSLLALTDQGIQLAKQLLKQSERKNDALMIGAGGFVEGLYLATGLVESFPKDMKPADRDLVLLPLTRSIVDQEAPLKDLVEVAKSIQGNADEQKLVAGLEELLKIYEALNLEDQIKNNKGDLILGDANLKAIMAKVKELRTSIVK